MGSIYILENQNKLMNNIKHETMKKGLGMNENDILIVSGLSDAYDSQQKGEIILEEYVCNLLKSFHITPHLKGYYYLKTAIIAVYEDCKKYCSTTKVLYPEIAVFYNTAPSRVERAIRYAIDKAWSAKTLDMQYGFCHNKPTNNEFIMTIVDHLHILEHKCRIRNV